MIVNKFRYEIIRKEEVGIKEAESLETDWYMGVHLYIIFDGSKFGIAYDAKEWSGPVTEYNVLIECKWEHVDILDTEYGTYVVAFFKGKCCCYSLFGEYKHSVSTIEVVATQICECVYDAIRYNCDKSERVLLLTSKSIVQYYDMKSEVMSDVYDWICPIDNEFIQCCKNDCVSIINIDNNILLPLNSQQEIVHNSYEYKDGNVYHVYTNRDCSENQWESYLIFYSKNENVFLKTKIYDQINMLGLLKIVFYFV